MNLGAPSTGRSCRGLVVCQDYWPTISDATLRLVSWCRMLKASGVSVDVLSTRPSRDWPEIITVEGTRVFRVDGWTTAFRRQRGSTNLMNWVSDYLERYDFLYFDAFNLAEVVSSQLGTRTHPVSVAVRFESVDSLRENVAFSLGNLNRVKRIQLLPPDPRSHQALIASGVSESSITRLHDVGAAVDRSIGARRRARAALGRACGELRSWPKDQVIVVPITNRRDWKWRNVIESIGKHAERRPNLRFWIIGDCQPYPNMLKYIRQLGWQYGVVTPGVFTDLELLIQAADLFVLDPGDQFLSWLVPTLGANRVPLLLARTGRSSQQIPEQAKACLFDSQTKNDLASKLDSWLENPTFLERAATILHNQAVQESPLQCQKFFDLFHSLCAAPTSDKLDSTSI